MSTVSQTETMSTTVSASTAQVAETLQQVTISLSVVSQHAARMGAQVPHTDFDGLLVDIGIFVLFGMLSSVSAQLVVDGRIWRSWDYRFADRPLSASGPAAENPPLPGQIPSGATLRIVVDRAPGVSREEFDERLAARGWVTAESVDYYDGLIEHEYGVFASAGFAVRRVLRALPDAFETQTQTPRQGVRR